MPDEIDEVTNRSGKPHAGLEVEGLLEPFPAVRLCLRALGTDGAKVDIFLHDYSIDQARGIADSIRRMAEAPAPTEPGMVPAVKYWLEVGGRSEPNPAVVVSLFSPGKDGASNVVRIPYEVHDARELAADIEEMADLMEKGGV